MSKQPSPSNPLDEAAAERVSLLDMLDEAKRELAMRERVYPHMVKTGKVKRDVAQEQKIRMLAIVRHLEKVWHAEGEPRPGQLKLGG